MCKKLGYSQYIIVTLEVTVSDSGVEHKTGFADSKISASDVWF